MLHKNTNILKSSTDKDILISFHVTRPFSRFIIGLLPLSVVPLLNRGLLFLYIHINCLFFPKKLHSILRDPLLKCDCSRNHCMVWNSSSLIPQQEMTCQRSGVCAADLGWWCAASKWKTTAAKRAHRTKSEAGCCSKGSQKSKKTLRNSLAICA